MATLKQRVLDAIRAEYPGNLTNQQLATRLRANEPSVRRAVKELEDAGQVQQQGFADYRYGTIKWQALFTVDWTPPAVDPVAEFESEGNTVNV